MNEMFSTFLKKEKEKKIINSFVKTIHLTNSINTNKKIKKNRNRKTIHANHKINCQPCLFLATPFLPSFFQLNLTSFFTHFSFVPFLIFATFPHSPFSTNKLDINAYETDPIGSSSIKASGTLSPIKQTYNIRNNVDLLTKAKLITWLISIPKKYATYSFSRQNKILY